MIRQRMGMSGLRRGLAVLTGVGLVLLLPSMAFAAQSIDPSEGVLVRVAGDATLGANERAGAVVVVDGHLDIAGQADVVVLVNASATLRSARVDTLVVVNGQADLLEDTVVTGDVWAPQSNIQDDGTVEIRGTTRTDLRGLFVGLWVFGVFFAMGLGILGLLSALAMAAIAPSTARRASRAIREDIGNVLVAGLVFWIALPLGATLLLLTVIGAPTAFAIWFFLLPVFALLGYVVTGIWLGELVVDKERAGRPYQAALLGTLILMAVSLVPFVGSLVGVAVAFVGGGSLALLGWRALRGEGAAEEITA